MKRKLLIILTLGLLMLALGCGAALAAGGYAFTAQPSTSLHGSDCTFIISWQTNFLPLKVEIKAYTYDSVEEVAAVTDAADLKRSMSWPIPMHKYSDDAYYRVIAYHDSVGSTNYAMSDTFVPDWDSLKFTKQPSGGYLFQYEEFRIDWETTFHPRKVTVHMGGRSHTDESPMPSWTFVPLSDAREGNSFMAAYYGDGPHDFIVSRSFEADWHSVGFAGKPKVSINNEGTAFLVKWWTGFVPEYAWLWHNTAGGADIEEKFTEGLAHQMSCELPFTHDADGDYYYIGAYSDYFNDYSDHFTKDFSLLDFTVQPSDGTVAILGRYSIQWTTTYKPTRVVLGYLDDSNQFVQIVEITKNLRPAMNYDLSYQECNNRPLRIRAYYNESNYKQSQTFTVTRLQTAYGFNGTMPDLTIEPGQVKTITWNANFVPMYVTLGIKNTDGSIFPMATIIKATMDPSMSYDLEWEKAQTGTMYVRAYYAINSYVETTFQVERVAASFLTSPYSRTIHLNETHTLNWSTTFVPKKVELVSKLNGVVKTITSGLKKTMSHTVQPFDPADSGTYFVRAYYVVTEKSWNDKFVTSSPFQMTSVAGAFTRQPAGGTVYPWTSCQLSWTTNFIPTRTEIGYMKNSSWTPVKVLSSGLQKSMTDVLSYDQAVSSQKWSIRAYYGEQDEYIPSTVFAVNKQAAFACGDSLTATFADGTLTISGTGAMYEYGNLASALPPWYSIRNEITSLVIGDGVTGIGQYSFINCANMTNAVLPVSVTKVGRNAFQNCKALRYVYYDGFRSQWNAIRFAEGNSCLQNAGVGYLYRSGRLGTTDVHYQLSGYDGSLRIYGSGGSTVHLTPPWYDVKQYITIIRVEGVDTIWEDAFRDCTEVKKVYLSSSVTLVDDMAFSFCTRMTDVYYDSSAYDWDSITIRPYNEPLLSAARHTEPHVGQLTGDLSWSVNDEGLLRIWLDDDLMGDGEDTAIPDYASYTVTPWYADYKDVITSLRIESGVTGIGKYAFRNLTNLRTIDVADTVTEIGYGAFAHCSSLEDFVLPDSVTAILDYAFQNCSYLEILHLPDSIENIGTGVFQNCYNLEKVWLPNRLTWIHSQLFLNDSLLDEICIPVTVTRIGESAFANCTALASSDGHVYFDGSSAQWKQISVSAYGNSCLTDAGNIHFDPEELRIDAAHFPDENFRSVVANAFDTDQSGWLSDSEIAAADSFCTEDTDYSTVQGMEYLTGMTFLMLDGAPSLTSMDLTANTGLTHAEVFDNALTELNLNGLSALRELVCDGNALTSLDVSMVDMKELYCYNNPMTSLTLGSQPNLQRLYCFGTDLDTLDLRGCQLLLDCVYNGEKTVTADYAEYKINTGRCLRVSPGTELLLPDTVPVDAAHFPDGAFRAYVSAHFDRNGSGWLGENEIALAGEINANEYDTSGMESLEGIWMFTELSRFILSDCPDLTEISLSANSKIAEIGMEDTGLTALDLSGLTPESCVITRTPLASLTLGGQPALSLLACRDTGLTSLDVTGCPLLLDAIANGARTEENGFVTFENGSAELTVDAGVQLVTGLTLTVAFDPLGGTAVESQGVPFGGTAEKPGDPMRAGALFTGWYTVPGCAADALYDFAVPVTGNTTLYAGWLIPKPNGVMELPAGLTAIEDEAFSGIAAEAVLIPAGVTSITGDPFSGSSVRYIYGSTDLVRNFAQANGYIFVPVRD